MKTLVVYYSRSGTTAKLAERIAEELSADKERINCTKSYDGFWGYLRGGTTAFAGSCRISRPFNMRQGTTI